MTGMPEEKKIKVVPIVTGEVHLQNTLGAPECYVCHKFIDDSMLIMRTAEKEMCFVCDHHTGVLQEFLRQFKTVPMGWVQTILKE